MARNYYVVADYPWFTQAWHITSTPLKPNPNRPEAYQNWFQDREGNWYIIWWEVAPMAEQIMLKLQDLTEFEDAMGDTLEYVRLHDKEEVR